MPSGIIRASAIKYLYRVKRLSESVPGTRLPWLFSGPNSGKGPAFYYAQDSTGENE